MKKSFLLHIRLSLAVVGIAAFTIAFPTITKAQNGWWTLCCVCGTGFQVDPKPPGYCRECTLLCPGCRKKLGDLDKAFEDLKQKNRVLSARYRAREEATTLANEKLIDAMVKTYGEERSPDQYFTFSGLNGSFGKFTVAGASLATNFETGGVIPKLTKYTADALSIYQSSGNPELGGNVSSTFVDIMTEDGVNQFFIPTVKLYKPGLKLFNDFQSGTSMTQSVKLFNQDLNRLKNVERLNAELDLANGLSIAADIFGLYTSGKDLLTGIADMYDNYKAREANEKEREKLQDEIVKNAGLMSCIKETQDSINHGGISFKKSQVINKSYAGKMLLGFFLPEILNNNRSYFKINQHADDNNYWEIDTIRIKSAMTQLKNHEALLKIMMNSFFEEIIPPLVPWILNRWKELKPATLMKLVQMLKSPLNVFMTNYKKLKALNESIIENVSKAVTGYEISYLSGTPEIISSEKNPPVNITGSADKWTVSANEKIKGEMGRVNMSFPAGVDWSIDFYTPENKFVTNRSSFSKHQPFYDITPGNYNIKLNNVIAGNVPVEKGKEVKLKSGFLSLVTRNPWQLYNESKEKFYTSGIKPVKFALPVGTYQLKFEDKYYRVVIKDRVTVKFESAIPLLFD